MIIDTLDNLRKYEGVNPLIAQVAEFLSANDVRQLAPGRHDILGDDLYVNIDVTPGRTVEEAPFETHRDMMDIQLPLSQAESYGYLPLDILPDAPYDAAHDITKYPLGTEAQCYVRCKPGQFVIFAPQDGHQPCLCEGEIRKAVFKLRHSL